MDLREWCSWTVVASYDPLEREEVWQEVLRYLDWLSELRICPEPLR